MFRVSSSCSAADRSASRLSRKAPLPAIRIGLVLLLTASALPACDARVREVKARLTPAEIARFDRGRQLAVPCWSCHDFYGEQNKVGPYLSGIVGRRIASARGFYYSEAFRSVSLVWTPQTLRAYLQNVTGFIPGSSMVFPSIVNARDAEAVVFYMEKVTSR
jgi:cytochrome c